MRDEKDAEAAAAAALTIAVSVMRISSARSTALSHSYSSPGSSGMVVRSVPDGEGFDVMLFVEKVLSAEECAIVIDIRLDGVEGAMNEECWNRGRQDSFTRSAW